MFGVELAEPGVGRAHVRHAAALDVLLAQQKGLGHEEHDSKGSKRGDEGVWRKGPRIAQSLAACGGVPVGSTVRHHVLGQGRHGEGRLLVSHAGLQVGRQRVGRVRGV